MRGRLSIVCMSIGLGCGDGPGTTEARPASEVAPAASVARGQVLDLRGATVDPFASDAAATVLLFVSTHCPISNRYAPTIATLFGDWSERGVSAWLVYPDPDDDAASIEAHQRDYGLALPTVRDPHHVLVARASARVTPEAAVFGSPSEPPVYRGRIDDRVAELGKVRPVATTHELSDAVSAVLAGDAPSEAVSPAIGCYISDLR